jgi:hypothetical protein
MPPTIVKFIEDRVPLSVKPLFFSRHNELNLKNSLKYLFFGFSVLAASHSKVLRVLEFRFK